MSITPGSETLACSARRCNKDADWAIVWFNPAIHYGRKKTWLSCAEHLPSLREYFDYRDFPYEVVFLSDWLAEQDQEGSSLTPYDWPLPN